MAALIESYRDRLAGKLNAYLNADLNDFYISSAHRWLVYAATFILAGFFTFVSLDLYERSDPLLTITLTFKGMYAWHTAINFSLSLAAVDHLAAWLLGSWGAFDRRSVAKTWIVLTAAYLVGFVFQRILVYRLVALYLPELLWVHAMDPSMRPGVLSMFLFMAPFWGLTGYSLICMMMRKQAQTRELLRVRIDTLLEVRQREASTGLAVRKAEAGSGASDGNRRLPLPSGVGLPPIRVNQIGHVTAEDHYLRIYYHVGGKLKNTLVRIALKNLAAHLPADRFIQIHRSHLVNLEQVAGIKRYGRNVRLRTQHGDFELPVSRYRFPKILPALERYLHP